MDNDATWHEMWQYFCREKFPDERIPHLQEVVDLCVNLGLQMYIDVKAASQAGKVCRQNVTLVCVVVQMFLWFKLFKFCILLLQSLVTDVRQRKNKKRSSFTIVSEWVFGSITIFYFPIPGSKCPQKLICKSPAVWQSYSLLILSKCNFSGKKLNIDILYYRNTLIRGKRAVHIDTASLTKNSSL